MRLSACFAGSLLTLLSMPSLSAEAQRPPTEPQAAEQQPLRRAVAEEAQARRDALPAPKTRRLSPEERSKLRKDVNDAGRRIYPHPIPAHY